MRGLRIRLLSYSTLMLEAQILKGSLCGATHLLRFILFR